MSIIMRGIHGQGLYGLMVERITSNDEILSSILSGGNKFAFWVYIMFFFKRESS